MRAVLLASSAVALVSATAAAAQAPRSVDEVEDITVIATRTEQRTDQAPATVSVITAERIEEELATDIKDLIRFEPGVSVPSQPARFGAALGSTGRDGNAGFTIRGLGGDRVLIITDGVRAPDGFTFGAQAVGRGGYGDLDLFRKVEILRGPASALYGSDGIAGAVSFTTKDPVDFLEPGQDFGGRARAAYGSADESWAESLAFAGRGGSVSGLLAYSRRDSEETETKGDIDAIGPTRTTANPMDLSSNAILGKLVWDVAANHSLRLTYDHFDSDMSAEVLSGITASTLQLTAEDVTDRDRIGLDWRFDAAFGLDAGYVAAYWQDAETRQFTFEDRNPAVDRTRDNGFDNRVVGLAAQGEKSVLAGGTEHRLVFGADWSETRQDGIRDGTVPPMGETFPTRPFPQTDYTLAGAFIQDEIVLMDGKLTITPALRYDGYELTGRDDALFPGTVADQSDGRFSPKIGAVYWATDTFGGYASYAEGFKAPSPMQVNNFFSNLAFGYTSAPNPDLKPETSRSFEAGLRWRDVNAFGGTASLQTTAFASDFDDFILRTVVSGSFTPADPAVYQYVNIRSVEVKGLEVRGRVNWDNGFGLEAAASYADGKQDDGAGETALASVDPIKVVLGLKYDDPNDRFGGQVIGTWSDRKDAADTDALGCYNADPALGCYVGDDFAILDVTGYWNLSDRVTARIGVFNVFDETYSWWSDVAGVSNTSLVKNAYTQPGRNVAVSLALRF